MNDNRVHPASEEHSVGEVAFEAAAFSDGSAHNGGGGGSELHTVQSRESTADRSSLGHKIVRKEGGIQRTGRRRSRTSSWAGRRVQSPHSQ